MKLKPGVNDLATLNPCLAAEWDCGKNHPLTPEKVLPKSNKRVWWKCSICGHSWRVAVYARSDGNGCPACAGKVAVPGINDLATLNPCLAAEWDYEKNHPLTPDKVLPKSNKRVWWKCQVCGHSWRAAVYNRSSGNGCPACAGKVAVPGINDLATLNPCLAAEWDYEKNHPLMPSNVTNKSGKRVWWKCQVCGHSWRAAVCDRSDGNGCPACAGKVAVPGINDLATLNPSMAAEWDYEKNHPLMPSNVTNKSGKRVWWKCQVCGHSWRVAVYARSDGSGCPACAGKVAVPGINDLATLNPCLAAEWDYEKNHPLMPSNVTNKSGKRVWWKCQVCGHSWRAAVCDRSYGSGCPACAGKAAVPGINDLATLNPCLAAEWDCGKNHPLTPDKVLPKSNKRVWWKCSICGHSWHAAVCDRSYGSGCPACAGCVAVPGMNDLASHNPGLVEEWNFEKNHPLTPDKVTLGSHKKVWWKCSACGYSWSATVYNRHKGSGCPSCAGKRRVKSCIVPV